MFGCKCCKCSSSIESLDLSKPHESITRREKITDAEAKSYKKLRISSFIPESYWVNGQQMNCNFNQDKQIDHQINLDKLTKVKNQINLETKPKLVFQPVEQSINEDEIVNEAETLIDQPDKKILEKMKKNKKLKLQKLEFYDSNESIYNFDYNLYSIKKNVGQGMIDIALLAANATQLKNVLNRGYANLNFLSENKFNDDQIDSIDYFNSTTSFNTQDEMKKKLNDLWSYYLFWLNIILVGLSIGLQIFVGILLLLNAKTNKKIASKPKGNAECYNNTILIFILFITVINVFIVIFVDEV